MENGEIGISIITCSINPESCGQMLESVKNTIGINYETIVFNNLEKGFGICQVYNYCAAKAIYPYLCFIHEDIIMSTQNWGKEMVDFAEKIKNCGVIGFAGGTTANKNFIGWNHGPKGRFRYYDSDTMGKINKIEELSFKYNNPENKKYAEVVTLDGLFLFVSREIWKKIPFDEERIKGFHFYDADFTFSISLKHQNFVCLTVDVYHFSGGNRTIAYYKNALIFQKKWKNELPIIIGEQKISFREEMHDARHLFFHMIRNGIKLKVCVEHIIEINGYIFFIIFIVLIPIIASKKKIIKCAAFIKNCIKKRK